MWCYSNGDEMTGLGFSNESIRIGIDLGLFRTLPREPTLCDDFARTIIRGEATVAWGLFNWHSYAIIVSLLSRYSPDEINNVRNNGSYLLT